MSSKKIVDIEKKQDDYSLKSAAQLKIINSKLMKEVFVGALRMIEMKMGSDFEGHDRVKSEIFRIGNNSIREFERIIDTFYNVEEVPNVISVFTGKDN